VSGGADSCQTDPFLSLGWHWSKDGRTRPNRQVSAGSADANLAGAANVSVAARPTVMVHGFGSTAAAWQTYLGSEGFLATIGVQGFAVGDGQVSGTLNTGNVANPTGRTNTIAENARILGEYIAGVKKLTGAQQVDLVAHSMGGLITRYYIDRVMQERDVAQLLMMGSPNQGTDCATLPASLDFYLPAVLEIRPDYVREVFNRQITHRKGVPFYLAAGNPISEPSKAPCTDVPSDLVISRSSAAGVAGTLSEVPLLHIDLNDSRQAFDTVVKPFLQKPPGQYPANPDPDPLGGSQPLLQFTRVFTGHVDAGSSRDYTINIDSVAVASFALFDPTRSLTVTVRGATGNIVELSAAANGLIVVDDPASLVYLGYGFNNPRPGAWHVSLQATAKTPPAGADFALTAQLRGGAVLSAQTNTLVPRTGESVRISARLGLGGQALPLLDARALIRDPNGQLQMVALAGSGDERAATWTPSLPGLHAVDVSVLSTGPDGLLIERTAFLSADVQPDEGLTPYVNVAVVIVIVLLLVGALVALSGRLIRRALHR
jgi:pimeloyl-ACP methyl ester carboxylesterase